MHDKNHSIFIGLGESSLHLPLVRANRHGLIAGATGTGKTVTLQIMAEGFSSQGVPVFLADVKGDLAGISQAGEPKPKILARAQKVGMADFQQRAFPTLFWDLFGQRGHPVRTTVSDMGPLLLARLLDLNDTQEGVINIAFKAADDEGLLLLDFKDLRAVLNYISEQSKSFSQNYGRVHSASIGTIQRKLLTLEQQGGDRFFGEPALELNDLMITDFYGNGVISILAADQLMHNPRAYATLLLWLMAELFEELPEVGDLDQPRLVFFFDEAHLLFDDAPRALVDKIEQVVRLIRSKGVGIYFVTQNPLDIPDAVLGQLGNRIQHALRAFTPREQRAVRAAAETFRVNPKLNVSEAITQLGVGEALVSLLDEQGRPGMVERAMIRPPMSRLGVITDAERQTSMLNSPVRSKYDHTVDRQSAHEMLLARAKEAAALEGLREERYAGTGRSASSPRSNRQGLAEAMAKSVARSIGSQLGRQIVRGILGSIFKKG
ncbi:DUF853 domain-containing protein [Desulfoferrobacter suflitae]|uniref:DUF853 domain-containing protein n=1 Tax=Desulfoferrobacter suflitae TaxID=2865782 RepID=UPI002164422A|nr:DUF853 domain-containing protein [Desulfoferrobacter suflitae]MCK8600441.1 DUF853 domain-containing protein [Desulfoferrobacter suflitae]